VTSLGKPPRHDKPKIPERNAKFNVESASRIAITFCARIAGRFVDNGNSPPSNNLGTGH